MRMSKHKKIKRKLSLMRLMRRDEKIKRRQEKAKKKRLKREEVRK